MNAFTTYHRWNYSKCSIESTDGLIISKKNSTIFNNNKIQKFLKKDGAKTSKKRFSISRNMRKTDRPNNDLLFKKIIQPQIIVKPNSSYAPLKLKIVEKIDPNFMYTPSYNTLPIITEVIHFYLYHNIIII